MKRLTNSNKEIHTLIDNAEYWLQVYFKLKDYEDFEEIFREKMTNAACDFLSDKEEFGKWLDRNKWIAKKCDEWARAEGQGRLVKLPCKVGDIVYFAHHDRVISSEVLSVKYHAEAENHGAFIRKRLTIDVEGISAEIDFGDIGKTVFLTKSEAEAKLKELRCNND